ncbi:hypothetical protein TOPH_03247 [Tolypocladium ophioglossoides CBS 100239]|uniref:Mitotic checkpoint regulator, MAD2B-interacting-domain-containing protein n=1 Tax=Tolypocladium ophioglossoides (strain CBS 100239) TaxID=1163406 RepID=A0A0L0NDX7_TOLOC|nr:hypothetical protein TOPH_03247 [Tolypocladium ophioglossoides CBS 100239]
MGLVDYSESESSGSDAEAPPKAPQKAPGPNSKKPFQKVVDRSNPGKIVVSLPQAAPDNKYAQEPPAKRARTAGGGLFSGFNSFLPAPKNAGRAPAGPSKTRPGVNLKTSAAPGFSREEGDGGDGGSEKPTGGLSLPPPKRQAEPSIPEGQKPADDVKLVGKPLMFRPLSVARNSKKKGSKLGTAKPARTTASPSSSSIAHQATQLSSTTEAQQPPAPAPAHKKVSLFSMHTEEAAEPTASSHLSDAYEPLYETGAQADASLDEYAQYAVQAGPAPTAAPAAESLDSIANDLNLSAAARRELFGRGGSSHTTKKVVNFNMDQEYEHNEAIRAAGDQQTHNPVRAIQGGKHSLQQLVQNVHNQREALEESFAKGKSNRKEASSRYGWA